MKHSHSSLVIAGILFVLVAGAYAEEVREYHSPDGLFRASVIALHKSSYGSGESRIELRSANGSLLFSRSYASNDGEHGFGVERAAWTPDSKFFVYSLSSSGGHQSWHFPTDFLASRTLRLRRLDDYVGAITDREFRIFPPDTVHAVGRRRTDWKEAAFEVQLSKLVKGKQRNRK